MAGLAGRARRGLANGWVRLLWHLLGCGVRRTQRCEVVLHRVMRKSFLGAGEVVKDCRWIEKVPLHQIVATLRCFETGLH